MNYCIICGKPVRSGANVCSSSCALKPIPKAETDKKEDKKEDNKEDDKEEESKASVVKAKTVPSLVSSLQNMLYLETVKEESKVILVKHRWMKNRNLVSNNTVLSFGSDGIAKVNGLGYMMNDIEAIMKRHPGQITIVQDEKPVVIENIDEPVLQERKPIEDVVEAKFLSSTEVEVIEEEKVVEAPRKKRQPMAKPRVEEED